MADIPEELLYTKEHEWVKIENGTAIIGITDFAQSELGDITFIELPSPGDEFSAGDSMAEVESVKAASEIFTAVTGKVIEVNDKLNDSPELLNEEPYKGGWVAKLELTDKENLDNLLDAGAYKTFCEEDS